MSLRDIRIIDLKRSKLDTREMDSLNSDLKKLEKSLSSLKQPKKPKDEAKIADYEKALKAHEKKSKDLETKTSAVKDKIAELEIAEKKERAKGKYKFEKKVYTNQKMADSLGGLDFGYKFKWNKNGAEYIEKWELQHGFELMTSKDPYLPEGAGTKIDAEGKHIFGDLVLMKITLRKYAEKQMKAQAKSDRAMASKFKEFQTTLASKGVEASDEFIGDWKKQLGID